MLHLSDIYFQNGISEAKAAADAFGSPRHEAASPYPHSTARGSPLRAQLSVSSERPASSSKTKGRNNGPTKRQAGQPEICMHYPSSETLPRRSMRSCMHAAPTLHCCPLDVLSNRARSLYTFRLQTSFQFRPYCCCCGCKNVAPWGSCTNCCAGTVPGAAGTNTWPAAPAPT